MESESCSSCRFWKTSPGNDKGLCRRLPPVFYPHSEHEDYYRYGEYPVTEEGEWCGEYRDKGVAGVERRSTTELEKLESALLNSDRETRYHQILAAIQHHFPTLSTRGQNCMTWAFFREEWTINRALHATAKQWLQLKAVAMSPLSKSLEPSRSGRIKLNQPPPKVSDWALLA